MPKRTQASLEKFWGLWHRLDLIVLNLGTNDLKASFDQSALSIAKGAKLLCQKAQAPDMGRAGVAPDILLVAPPPITKITSTIRVDFEGATRKSKMLAKHFSEIAIELNIHFMDASELITPSKKDPIHWDASSHQIIGNVIAERIKQILYLEKIK